MFYIAQGVKTVVMSTLIVALFFPYGIAGLLSLNGLVGSLADIVFFVIKVIVISFVSVSLIRVGMARFRINQVVSLYWTYLAGFGILGLVLIMVDPLVKVV
jgi:NADH:ubiquinone oxidoreductase subunit H